MAAASAALLPCRLAFVVGLLIVQLLFLLWFLWAAFDIRMYPIRDYGMLIHEFDPWFNYRAAEYMCEHGLSKFFTWYDHMSWYPIGRPIGTTTYPGMQITACAIRDAMWQVPAFDYRVPSEWLAWLRRALAMLRAWGFGGFPEIPDVLQFAPLSVNDICCLIPPWFGALASIFTGFLAHEVTRSNNAALVATGIMAVIPAHLMRSIGGKFDNEAVAMAAISSTFWLWLRSVRTPRSWPIGILAGLSYIYMVLAWGGYIFVLNMVGLHALVLVALGRFNSGVHKAYSLFFLVGTYGAIQIPVVGWQPLRSLEQIGPLLVFLGYQVLAGCDAVRRRQKMSVSAFVSFRIKVVIAFLMALFAVSVLLYPTGYFGPLSARIRGLFVRHTKTGNPLVDSVAEHMPAKPGSYDRLLGLPLTYCIHGAVVCAFRRSSACYFAGIYAIVAMHFSGKMSRLLLICAPIVAVGSSIWFGFLLDVMMEPILWLLGKPGQEAAIVSDSGEASTKAKGEKEKPSPKAAPKGKDKGSNDKAVSKSKQKTAETPKSYELQEFEEEFRPGGMMMLINDLQSSLSQVIAEEAKRMAKMVRTGGDKQFFLGRLALSGFILARLMSLVPEIAAWIDDCHAYGQALSNPKVVTTMRDQHGQPVLVDDYYQGYRWLAKNTPEDARIIAWWDYGYQITGIANRTSLADGNTWNHEHIATLGRTLTSPEKRAWNAIRHLADYLLVWAGGRGDDLAKSPHLARIGNSVFPDHCGDDDPRCAKFGFNADGTPTPMMRASLLYKAVKHKLTPDVQVDPRYFEEVHTTRYGKMRIFKVVNISEESKAWIADPKNRICDAPGSWYCVGQYPPALDKLLAKRRSFAQVEDFNKAGQKSAYTRMVEQELSGGGRGKSP